jgi:hypothetical protein
MGKEIVLNEFIKEVGKMSIMVFTAFDLKTHIEGMVIDEETKEQYVITVNKVSNGKLFKDGGIVFTKQQQDEFAIGFSKFIRGNCLAEDSFIYWWYRGKKYNEKELLEIYKQQLPK